MTDHSPANETAPPASPAPLRGLTEGEAAARLLAEGPNELQRAGRRSVAAILIEVAREPMFGLLLAAGLIYLALGDVREGIVLFVFACASVAIAVVQQARSERVLAALGEMTSPRALVVRDGERRRVAGREVVRGDVVVLSEGDRVPADAVLRSADNFMTDESLLTGESVPVGKTALPPGEAALAARPGGDGLPQVFSGSLVVAGQGIAEVVATGPRSEIGRIGGALAAIAPEPPRLAQETRRLVRAFAFFGLVASVVAVLLHGLARGGWLDALLAGIALGMSMLPEEFPLVLTVFMVMGAWRISAAGVLTRRPAAIETLGAATVLCTDKTGTLTRNRMTIGEVRAGHAVWRPAEGATPPEAIRAVVGHGLLASAPEPFDPMEKAFHALGSEGHAALPGERRLLQQYGLTAELLAVANVWDLGPGDHLVAAKGAPEAIATLCRLDPAASAVVHREAADMARRGMRVLGVAMAGADPAAARPRAPGGFGAFSFLGLVGLVDPLRPGVTDAIAECRRAGVRVLMITGDHPATAHAIAVEAGLAAGDADAVVTGTEIAGLDGAALRERVARASVFARVLPEQKLRIVEALKANGEIVVMTGDGVNDAPSLKAAHIGIAMGARGTDVAREAASLVLVEDDFAAIVAAARLGRRIHDNLMKAMGYIMAVHVPIAGLALLPLLLGLPVILLPIHIAFLEMVIDPVCSLVFEAEEAEDEVMHRPPRQPEAPLFTGQMIAWSLAQGLLVLGVVGGLFVLGHRAGLGEDELRSLAFTALVVGNGGLVLVNRSFSADFRRAFGGRNRMLWWVAATTALVLAASLNIPLLSELFRFGPLHAHDLALALGAGAALVVLLEGGKRVLGLDLAPHRAKGR